jgi:hypothetical protein
VTYCNLASVKAITSVLNAANRFHHQAAYEKEENMSFSKKIEKEDVCDYDKALNNRLVSPSDDISDLDLNLLESGDNSKYIFPLSPGTNNDASKGKPVSTPPLYDTDMLSKDLHSGITSAKAIQSAFTSAGSSNAPLKVSGRDCNHWSKSFEPCNQERDYENER